MNLDKQRIAAVKTLESLGYSWEGGVQWKPPLGKEYDVVYRTQLDEAMRTIAAQHVTADSGVDLLGVLPGPANWPVPENYLEAWRTVCRHLGFPVKP